MPLNDEAKVFLEQTGRGAVSLSESFTPSERDEFLDPKMHLDVCLQHGLCQDQSWKRALAQHIADNRQEAERLLAGIFGLM